MKICDSSVHLATCLVLQARMHREGAWDSLEALYDGRDGTSVSMMLRDVILTAYQGNTEDYIAKIRNAFHLLSTTAIKFDDNQ